MYNVFIIAALVTLAGVVLTMLAGMMALSRGGDRARRKSQTYMRLRVMLQAATVVLLLAGWLLG